MPPSRLRVMMNECSLQQRSQSLSGTFKEQVGDKSEGFTGGRGLSAPTWSPGSSMSSAQGPPPPWGSPRKPARSSGALQGNSAGKSARSPLSTASQVTLRCSQGRRGRGPWGSRHPTGQGWHPSLGSQQDLALVQASRALRL